MTTAADTEKYPITPAALVAMLADAGHSPTAVSQMLGKRISFRALYRWRRGEAAPQRYADYLDVLQLAVQLGLVPSTETPSDLGLGVAPATVSNPRGNDDVDVYGEEPEGDTELDSQGEGEE